MRYPKGSLNRENYREHATVSFVAGSRLLAQSQMAQFKYLNDYELSRRVCRVVGLIKPAANSTTARCVEMKDNVNCERAPDDPRCARLRQQKMASVAKDGCAVSGHGGNLQCAARKSDPEGDQAGDTACCGDAARARR